MIWWELVVGRCNAPHTCLIRTWIREVISKDFEARNLDIFGYFREFLGVLRTCDILRLCWFRILFYRFVNHKMSYLLQSTEEPFKSTHLKYCSTTPIINFLVKRSVNSSFVTLFQKKKKQNSFHTEPCVNDMLIEITSIFHTKIPCDFLHEWRLAGISFYRKQGKEILKRKDNILSQFCF